MMTKEYLEQLMEILLDQGTDGPPYYVIRKKIISKYLLICFRTSSQYKEKPQDLTEDILNAYLFSAFIEKTFLDDKFYGYEEYSPEIVPNQINSILLIMNALCSEGILSPIERKELLATLYHAFVTFNPFFRTVKKTQSRNIEESVYDIERLVSIIEKHWEYMLKAPDDGALPAGERIYLKLYQGLINCGWIKNPAEPFVNYFEQSEAKALGSKGLAAASTYEHFKAACWRELNRSELNSLGWSLTKILALDSKPIKDVLKIAGKKGGNQTAKQTKKNFNLAADATCKVARALMKEKLLSKSELINLLAERAGKSLTKPTIRKHLRTQELYPAEKKRKPS